MELGRTNLHTMHWNPGASMPLILPVHVRCNTSDEELIENVRANSALRSRRWLALMEEHDGVAVICGGGPSLERARDDVRALRKTGAKVFALNGAAGYLLHDWNVLPDYQVIVDAREETAQLVGPAKEHLFASQCHPETFARAPQALLWHVQIEAIESALPEDHAAYALIGGGASVGNTALCLAYAMGYRRLELFGYDSCHSGARGHAFAQPMNDGDPLCEVTHEGCEYVCSLTMKLQAEKFPQTARALEARGCEIVVHGEGLLPAMWRSRQSAMPEEQKYAAMWEHEAYRDYSPGEAAVEHFMALARPEGAVMDIGCGTGRASVAMHACGLMPVLVDFVDNCRDDAALFLPFFKMDITERLPLHVPMGFCCDVMEHIPAAGVDRVLRNIAAHCGRTYFRIATVADACGALIGEQLHVTVHEGAWWLARLRAAGHEILHFEELDQEIVALTRSQPLEAENG